MTYPCCRCEHFGAKHLRFFCTLILLSTPHTTVPHVPRPLKPSPGQCRPSLTHFRFFSSHQSCPVLIISPKTRFHLCNQHFATIPFSTSIPRRITHPPLSTKAVTVNHFHCSRAFHLLPKSLKGTFNTSLILHSCAPLLLSPAFLIHPLVIALQ